MPTFGVTAGGNCPCTWPAGGGHTCGVPTVTVIFFNIICCCTALDIQQSSSNSGTDYPKTVGISTPGLNLRYLLEPN